MAVWLSECYIDGGDQLSWRKEKETEGELFAQVSGTGGTRCYRDGGRGFRSRPIAGAQGQPNQKQSQGADLGCFETGAEIRACFSHDVKKPFKGNGTSREFP